MGGAWVGPLDWIPVGWGTPPPTSPRAAERSGGRTPSPGSRARTGSCGPCTERVRGFSGKSGQRPRRAVDLAEKRPSDRRV